MTAQCASSCCVLSNRSPAGFPSFNTRVWPMVKATCKATRCWFSENRKFRSPIHYNISLQRYFATRPIAVDCNVSKNQKVLNETSLQTFSHRDICSSSSRLRSSVAAPLRTRHSRHRPQENGRGRRQFPHHAGRLRLGAVSEGGG